VPVGHPETANKLIGSFVEVGPPWLEVWSVDIDQFLVHFLNDERPYQANLMTAHRRSVGARANFLLATTRKSRKSARLLITGQLQADWSTGCEWKGRLGAEQKNQMADLHWQPQLADRHWRP